MYCEQPSVGCVSPLMLSGKTVWCSGLVFGNDGLGYAMRGWQPESDGYVGSLSCARGVSAVSGECLMIRASVFRGLGGKVKYYSTSCFDGVDLSLRARTANRRNIVTPRSIVRRRTEPEPPNGSKLDSDLFTDRWQDLIQREDPYYISQFVAQTPVYSDAFAAVSA
jgi:hypothetical protein